ncbi:MAG TPA: hypothetical protein VIQ99_07990, partial [Gammaproteobacteria bacterium]
MRYAALLPLLVSSLVMAAPPATERRPFVYVEHGQRLEDPYRWLEGSAAPELTQPDPDLDAQVSRWTDDQNAYSRAVLDALPGRAAVSAELERLLSLDAFGIPREAGEWLFYSLRRGDEAQPVLYVQRGVDGEPRELIN